MVPFIGNFTSKTMRDYRTLSRFETMRYGRGRAILFLLEIHRHTAHDSFHEYLAVS